MQGSLHYTPEHCLVNGGFPLFWWKKTIFQLGKLYPLRSPVFNILIPANGLENPQVFSRTSLCGSPKNPPPPRPRPRPPKPAWSFGCRSYPGPRRSLRPPRTWRPEPFASKTVSHCVCVFSYHVQFLEGTVLAPVLKGNQEESTHVGTPKWNGSLFTSKFGYPETAPFQAPNARPILVILAMLGLKAPNEEAFFTGPLYRKICVPQPKASWLSPIHVTASKEISVIGFLRITIRKPPPVFPVKRVARKRLTAKTKDFPRS